MTPPTCQRTHGYRDDLCGKPAAYVIEYPETYVCQECYTALPANFRASARRVTAEVPTVEAFTLVDRQFCERVAAEFYAAQAEDSGLAWASLAARMQRVMEGQYTTFTKADAVLVESLHMAALRNGLAEGAKERSRMCSRLGVLLVLARRGRLAQLRAKA